MHTILIFEKSTNIGYTSIFWNIWYALEFCKRRKVNIPWYCI